MTLNPEESAIRKTSPDRRVRATLLVFFVALAVRVAYLFEASDSPAFGLPINDAEIYDQLARALVLKGDVGWRFFYQGVFYPLFLSAVYGIFGPSVLAAKAVQAVIGAVTAALVQRYSARIGGSFVGITAGMITALYGPLVFFETELLATGWAAFFSVALLWMFCLVEEKPVLLRFLLLGSVAGLSVLTRAVFLPFFAIAAIWLCLRLRKRGAKAVPRGVIAMVIGVVLVTAPVGIASYRITHRFHVLPFSGGVNLHLGNNESTCDTLTLRPGKEWWEMINLPLKHGRTNPWDKEAFYTERFWDYVKENPIGFAVGIGRKTLQFVNGREIPRSFDLYLQRRWSHILFAGVWKIGRFGFPFGALFALGVLGIACRRKALPVPVQLLLVLYPLSVIAVFVAARYRVPLVPVLALPAALGIRSFLAILRKGVAVQRRVEVVMVFLTALLLATVPPVFCEERVSLEAEMYFMTAAMEQRRGNFEEAIRRYRRAVELDPSYYEAVETFGVFLNERGKLIEALPLLERAVQLEPEAGKSLLYLGKTLGQLRKYREGEAVLRRALAKEPKSGPAHSYMGICLANQGKFEEAYTHLKEAVALLPGDELTRYNYEKVRDKVDSGSSK